jgi:hypothetical protein
MTGFKTQAVVLVLCSFSDIRIGFSAGSVLPINHRVALRPQQVSYTMFAWKTTYKTALRWSVVAVAAAVAQFTGL